MILVHIKTEPRLDPLLAREVTPVDPTNSPAKHGRNHIIYGIESPEDINTLEDIFEPYDSRRRGTDPK